LQRLIEAERKRVQTAAAELQAQTFYCRDDAETAAGAWLMVEENGLLPVKALK